MNYIRLDWSDKGYFFDRARLPALSRGWRRWGEIYEACRAGDFSSTPELLDLLQPRTDDVLSRACGVLLGDAGCGIAMQRVADFVRSSFASLQPFGLDNALVISDALTSDGDMGFITDLLEIFDWNLGGEDSAIFALHLSRMLESSWDFISESPRDRGDFAAYRELVLEKADEMKKWFGTNTRLFMGKPTSPDTTARLMLDLLGVSDFEQAMQPQLRRRFEAVTGIDCSSFFSDGIFQPLAAASTLESFLHREAAFIPGVKYFFGHRVV